MDKIRSIWSCLFGYSKFIMSFNQWLPRVKARGLTTLRFSMIILMRSMAFLLSASLPFALRLPESILIRKAEKENENGEEKESIIDSRTSRDFTISLRSSGLATTPLLLGFLLFFLLLHLLLVLARL